MTYSLEKAEILNAILNSVFPSKMDLQKSLAPEARVQVWNKEDLVLFFLEEIQVRKYSSKLEVCTSMGPERMNPRVLRDLADVVLFHS